MTFVYLSDIDLQCHMLWRHRTRSTRTRRPIRRARRPAAQKHADDIEGYYRARRRAPRPRARAAARRTPRSSSCRDHGFQPFTRKVHLNAWLRDHGWLTLKDGKRTGRIAAGDVDWTQTRAYGLGFNSVYLNLAGREAEGIVPPAEADAVAAELAARAPRRSPTPRTGKRVVRRVFRGKDTFHGARAAEAPDLVVGYDVGYGASDETTLGEVTAEVIADNTSRWSGNHLMDPEVVPGVLLSNRKIAGDGHGLADVTATILAWYGLPPNQGMTGKSIF